MPDARHALGERGEQAAEAHLRRAGLRTLARRYRTPVGELDLVMREGDTIVFVEVKTQRDERYADPEQRVSLEKQRKTARCAAWYLNAHRKQDAACRFDVVTVICDTEPPRVTHHRDAFAPS